MFDRRLAIGAEGVVFSRDSVETLHPSAAPFSLTGLVMALGKFDNLTNAVKGSERS